MSELFYTNIEAPEMEFRLEYPNLPISNYLNHLKEIIPNQYFILI